MYITSFSTLMCRPVILTLRCTFLFANLLFTYACSFVVVAISEASVRQFSPIVSITQKKYRKEVVSRRLMIYSFPFFDHSFSVAQQWEIILFVL